MDEISFVIIIVSILIILYIIIEKGNYISDKLIENINEIINIFLKLIRSK